MSIEELHADLVANIAEAKTLTAMSTQGDVTNHLNNTLWPFLENLVREINDVDEAVGAMYEKSEDILQYDTGREIAVVVGGAIQLIAELEKRAAGDEPLLKAIQEWRAKAQGVSEILEEITLPEDFDGEEADDDEDEEDDETDDDKKGNA